MHVHIPILFIVLLASFSASVSAFPQYLLNSRIRSPQLLDDVAYTLAVTKFTGILLAPSTCPNSTYHVDHDKYPFVAPGPGDKRGPCPGLNALANHGYM